LVRSPPSAALDGRTQPPDHRVRAHERARAVRPVASRPQPRPAHDAPRSLDPYLHSGPTRVSAVPTRARGSSMRTLIAFRSCLVTVSACGNVPSAPPDQRAEIDVTLPDASAAELDRLRERLDELEALEAPALLESRALSYASELGYTPRDAEHMTLIQGSSIA